MRSGFLLRFFQGKYWVWLAVGLLVVVLAAGAWLLVPQKHTGGSARQNTGNLRVKPPAPDSSPSDVLPDTAGLHHCSIRLHDVSAESGIDFVHTDGSSGRHYIIEAMSAGLAIFDYDGDGREDIYFLNGAPLLGTEVDSPPRNALYRNLGSFRFENVSGVSGSDDLGFGLGVTAGDYNQDGFVDIYLNNSGPNVLLRNNGDGTFSDVTVEAGVDNGDKVGAGASFLDIDNDGDLDLYVANYLVFRYELHVVRFTAGYPTYPSPRDYRPVPDTLYRNEGDGTFKDISEPSGVGRCAGTGMGIVAADYDADGDTDVFVCNDVAQNFLFINYGTGNFEEMGLLLGAAYNCFGDENASMGVDCGDYDNDGRLDFMMTSYQGELPVLYRNMGDGRLEDVTAATGAGTGVFQHVNWGVGLVDFDNDGHRDIFIANGHTEDNVDYFDQTTSYKARNTLLWNLGTGRFQEVSRLCGDGLQPVHASRGAAFEDLDDDGDVDVAVLNSREKPTILRNDTPPVHRWLKVHLRGVRQNRFGVGAQVRVHAGKESWVAEVHSGRGYQSHWGLRLHFGLGKHKEVDRLVVRWLGGKIQELGSVPTNQTIVITEDHDAWEVLQPHDRPVAERQDMLGR